MKLLRRLKLEIIHVEQQFWQNADVRGVWVTKKLMRLHKEKIKYYDEFS